MFAGKDFNPSSLLRRILDREITVTDVVSSPSLSSEEAVDIIRDLSRAAAEMGLSRVLAELGETEHIGADPLADVPEVRPVTTEKACTCDPFVSNLCA
jgi:DNA-directed RNA polymerase